MSVKHVKLGLPFSCYRQVSHTALCFLYLFRCLLIKETKLVSMIRYSLSKYDKTCIAITLLVKNLQLVYVLSRGVPKWTFYKYIVCQIYEKNGLLQKSSYRMSLKPIRNPLIKCRLRYILT